jgi:hydroxypyruvate reductase
MTRLDPQASLVPSETRDDPRGRLLQVYSTALAAVDGRATVRRALAARGTTGPVWLIGIGKAAAAMTLGALDHLGPACSGGLLIDKHPPADPRPMAACGITCLVGGHPLPTGDSLGAGERLLEALARRPPGATLLFLISGGTSSLVEVPAAGLGRSDLEGINRWLLGSGLPIRAMNRVRTAVSQIKGGGLLSHLPPGPLRALAISDVPGDDPAVIGSGLLVPAPDLAQGLADLDLPTWLRRQVDLGLAQRAPPLAAGPAIELVATNGMARQAAAEAARALGLPVRVHDECLEGDAADRGREIARRIQEGPPGLQVWGGETTVRLPAAPGRGGRNQHLALAAALALAGRADCLLLAAGTDGGDGDGGDAGALVDGGTLERAALDGWVGTDCLARADSGSLLAAAGDLIQTGPTGTNVMDLVLGLKC